MIEILLFFILTIGTSEIIEGKPETFGPTIEDNEVVMVMFHKNTFNEMKKEMEKFINDNKITIPIVEVDCTTQQVICQTEHIRTYPSFFIYYKIDFVTKFYSFGDELKSSLINRMNGMKQIQKNEIDGKKGKESFVVYSGPAGKYADELGVVSRQVGEMAFYRVDQTGDEPTIDIYHKTYGQITVSLNDNEEKKRSMISSYSLGLVNELTSELLVRNYNQRDVVVYLNDNIDTTEVKELETIAAKHQSQLFTYLTTENPLMRLLPFEQVPSILVISMNTNEAKKPMKLSSDMKKRLEEINDYATKCENLEIDDYKRMSEVIPEEKQGLLREINALQFDDMTKDSNDVVILLCDNYSPDCLKFKREFEMAQNMLYNHKNVDVAFIDVEKNQISTCTSEYPMVVMYHGIDKSRSCFADTRPPSAKMVITLLRERGVHPVNVKSFNPETEMVDPEVALKERQSILKARGMYKKSEEYQTKKKELVSDLRKKKDLFEARERIRALNELD